MTKRSAIIGIIVLGWCFYVLTKQREPGLKPAIQERYNGGDFTMTLPNNGISVKAETTTNGEQQMHAYSFTSGFIDYRVQYSDFSTPRESTPEEIYRDVVPTIFDPNYSLTFSKAHLSSLPATVAEVEGTDKGKPTFLKSYLAFSDDHKRMWMVVLTAPDRQKFYSAAAYEFFDSIQIKSR